MENILEEIKRLRNEESLSIDRNNNNRYRVIVDERDGSKTAYYFSSPIYNVHSRKAVNLKFETNDSRAVFTGSNAKISIFPHVCLENKEGVCNLFFDYTTGRIEENIVKMNDINIFPTLNGIAIKAKLNHTFSFSFELQTGVTYLGISNNTKSFCIMREAHRPFCSISCIGALNNNEIISSAKINAKKINNQKFSINISPLCNHAEFVLFEINLYEHKLFQDTTVESANPIDNNAFGGMAFLGYTPSFGEQWIYSKLDFSKVTEILDKQINSIKLYMPKYNTINNSLELFKAASRFCSFGTIWQNKKPTSNLISAGVLVGNYVSFDLYPLLVNSSTTRLMNNNGMIIKPRDKSCDALITSTGDNYYAPQILEVNYK